MASAIRIREQSALPDGTFTALVTFDGEEAGYPCAISDPFTPEQEKNLEWYFEEHLRFPFLDNVKADAAAVSITTYGEALFRQVFANPDAYAQYVALRPNLHDVRIDIVGSPDFNRFHWEALKDPAPMLAKPLSILATMVRKNVKPQAIRATFAPSPTVNLLIVTARPGGARDVGYRTISRPLVEGLRQADVPVQVDILRPGTYQALVQHLEDARSCPGFAGYHVLHFDLHGGLLTHDELAAGMKSDRYLFQARYARGAITPYPGLKAYLLFAGTQDGQSDLVEAEDLAKLLITHNIPIAILNACQSGKQVGGGLETSLGSRLMEAGVQTVLAMGYSVTVSAAELMMRTLYTKLFEGQGLSSAIGQARRELHDNKERTAYFNQTINLEDWLLPVAYQNPAQDVALKTRDFTPEEQTRHYEGIAARYPLPTVAYGFVGRDLDVLEIEKRLLAKRNTILIRGMGGAGKTTLLHHLAWWWQTTHFVDQVAYFGYDERAWNRQQIMHALADKLLTPGQRATFLPMPPEAQQAMLADRLRAGRHLLILDNLESITGERLAIQNTLPQDEQAKLRSFIAALSGGKTLVLLGSRSGEEWLEPDTFADNVYDLPGLDPEAASTLAEMILEKHKVTKYRKDKDFQKLLKLLDGYPLPLEVVLGNLAKQTPAEVLAALEAGDVRLDTGDAQEKTKSILACVAYSHSNLSPEAQELLICLAPFTSVVNIGGLKKYSEELKKCSLFAHLPFDNWLEILKEAEIGLVSQHPFSPEFLKLQPIFPYFLRSRLTDRDQNDRWQEIETAFRSFYDNYSSAICGLLFADDARKLNMGRNVAHFEYENIYTALNLMLKAHCSVFNPFMALSTFLHTLIDNIRGLDLCDMILLRLREYPVEKMTDFVIVDIYSVYREMGRLQQNLRQFDSAVQCFEAALFTLTSHAEINSDKVRIWNADIYCDLGLLTGEQRQWDVAKHNFEIALEIYVDLMEYSKQATTYHELGLLSQNEGKPEQSEEYFLRAVELFSKVNRIRKQAGPYLHLGMLAARSEQYDRAVGYFKDALEAFKDFDDYLGIAMVHGNMGSMYLKQADSVTITEVLYGKSNVGVRLKNTSADQVSISIITFTELLQGWVAGINRSLARPKSDICRAYDNLAQAQEDLRSFKTIRYTSQMEAIYQTFPSSVKRVGTNDCRIAATAIAHGLIVVTRNVRDFSRIPNVKFEDWTI